MVDSRLFFSKAEGGGMKKIFKEAQELNAVLVLDYFEPSVFMGE